MRSLVYTVCTGTLPILETFDYTFANRLKESGYSISARLITRKTLQTEEAKRIANIRKAHLEKR